LIGYVLVVSSGVHFQEKDENWNVYVLKKDGNKHRALFVLLYLFSVLLKLEISIQAEG
jgi:hypothetical protein